METSAYHNPVMLKESIDALNIFPSGKYVDATFGGGGHSRAILEKLNQEGKLYAFDQDKDALQNVPADDRLVFINQNFRNLRRFLKLYNADGVNGILADLGISSYQIDTPDRGFSMRHNAKLDMRMDNNQITKASDILNTYTATQLQIIFSQYGEVRNAKTLARLITEERIKEPFSTTGNFIERIESCIRGNRPRYLAQVFQSLRMEINQELQSLEEFLSESNEVLKPGGRMVVITYHSLEDRMVKNYFKSGNVKGELKADAFGHVSRPFNSVFKKPLRASVTEIKNNSRARSAKLRVAEKN